MVDKVIIDKYNVIKDNRSGGEKMICVPAEIEIDDKSIIAQMERVTDAQYKLENEMDKLRKMILSTKVKEKRDSEESQKD